MKLETQGGTYTDAFIDRNSGVTVKAETAGLKQQQHKYGKH